MVAGKREKFAQLGIATKGFVYFLIGVLTGMTAIGIGGKKTGKSGVLEFIADFPFGQVLLFIIAFGLAGYVFWRFYQAFTGGGKKDGQTKKILTRIAYFLSGIVYGFLAFLAVQVATGGGSSEGGKEAVISTLLNKPYGQILVGLLGVIILGKAVYEIYVAHSNKFNEKIRGSQLDEKSKKLVLTSGKTGHTARGIVLAIIAYLTFKTSFSANSEEAAGTKDALDFVQNEFGPIVLAFIAAGLIAYGVFMFIQAKYANLELNI